MNVAENSFNVLSLCTGAGMLDGVRVAIPSARLVCCVEWESYASEILASRMEGKALDDAPIWTNLRTFDGRPWRGVVDCVIAGYPCPPFSQAGKRLGAADPRHLWPEVARVIRECQPGFVFLENVAGHLTLGFDEVARDLEQMDYRVTPGVFSAEEVGAPHQRERLFILGHSIGGRRTGDDWGRANQITQNGHPLMANSNHCAGCEKPRLESEVQPTIPGRGGKALADTQDAVRRRGERGEEKRTWTDGSGRWRSSGGRGDVADTSGAGSLQPEDARADRPDEGERARRSELERGRLLMADPESTGLQGLRPEDQAGGGASLSHFTESGERIHSSPQVRVISTHGGELSKTDPQTSERRRLNPAFVCWLMGWPWWWTRAEEISFARAETESYLSKLRSHLSSLLEKLD